MNASNRKQLIQNLSKSAIFAITVATIAGQALAEKPQPSAATLTLLSEINEVLANTADSEGLSQETLVQLAESVLWTNEPSVDIASSEPALLSSYSGAKLTNNNGEIAYIAINTSAVETVVSFPDTYSMNVPADGFAIRLQNFGHNYYILDFGGKIVVDGRDFLIATPGTAIELPYVGDGRSYTFTDSGMSLDSGAITVNGAMEVFGTDGDDDFDFRGLETSPSSVINLNGGIGIDAIYGPNFESINWNISGVDTGSADFNITFKNIESITGSQGSDIFEIETDGSITGTIDGNSLEITSTDNIEIEGSISAVDSLIITAQSTITLSANSQPGNAGIEADETTTPTINTATLTLGTSDVTHTIQLDTDAFVSESNSGEIAVFEIDSSLVQSDSVELTITVESATSGLVSEATIESDTSNEKTSTNDESGGGSFNLFSLLIFGFLSLVHIRKTKN